MGSGSSMMVADLHDCKRRRDRPSILVERILYGDWIGVLARINSNPNEVSVKLNMKLYGMYRTHVTPLHLACALRPPLRVIDALLLEDTGHSATVFIRNDKKRDASTKERPPKYQSDTKNTDNGVVKSTGKSDLALPRRSNRFFEMRHRDCRSACKTNLSLPSFKAIHRHVRSAKFLFWPSKQSPFYSIVDDDNILGGFSSPGLMDQVGIFEDIEGQTSAKRNFLQESLSIVSTSRVSGVVVDEEDENEDDSYFQVSEHRLAQRSLLPPARTTPSTAKQRTNEQEQNRRRDLSRRISEGRFQACSAVADSACSHWLPLHVACLFRASPEVILALIRACPWATKVMNGMGMLPIHILCSGIQEPHPPGMLELSAMTERNAAWNLVRCVHLLLRAFPEAVYMTSSNLDDMTPMQYAERNLSSRCDEIDAVKKILIRPINQFEPIVSLAVIPKVHSIQYDEIASRIKMRVFNERAPTKLWHHISKREWRHALIRTSRAPHEVSVLTMVDDDNKCSTSYYRLALHKACTLRPPLALVQALVSIYPKSVSIREKYAMLPLHVACAFGADVSVVNFLIASNKAALRTADVWGRCPLHVAAVAGAKLQTLHVVMGGYPEAIHHVDKKGRTPADCVVLSRSHEKDLLLAALRVQSISLQNQYSSTVERALEAAAMNSGSSSTSNANISDVSLLPPSQ